ncbi:MAG: family N-acetyltransferase [Arthrobacter sp.]|nr:family N-acetyltransferase [Arthrobacter sp.]
MQPESLPASDPRLDACIAALPEWPGFALLEHMESLGGNGVRLVGSVRVRVPRVSDAEGLSAAYQRNREHLAPWEPRRNEDFFTVAGQAASIESKLALFIAGSDVPWVLLDEGRIVGVMTLSGIVRGPFLSAHLGYWVDKDYTGRGVGSAAVAYAVDAARTELGLHRLQAATLPQNAASQKILKRSHFEEIGLAPAYLEIAGAWQDHILYQRILF